MIIGNSNHRSGPLSRRGQMAEQRVFDMKTSQATYATTDRNGNPATYGFDRHGSWLEFSVKRDRTAIYGNSSANRQRMRREISERGIKVPANHQRLFSEPMKLAA